MEKNKSITTDQIMEAIYRARKKYMITKYSKINLQGVPLTVPYTLLDLHDEPDDEYKYPFSFYPACTL